MPVGVGGAGHPFRFLGPSSALVQGDTLVLADSNMIGNAAVRRFSQRTGQEMSFLAVEGWSDHCGLTPIGDFVAATVRHGRAAQLVALSDGPVRTLIEVAPQFDAWCIVRSSG